jgi:hypothetical protein
LVRALVEETATPLQEVAFKYLGFDPKSVQYLRRPIAELASRIKPLCRSSIETSGRLSCHPLAMLDRKPGVPKNV